MASQLAKIIADFQTQLATELAVGGTSATLQSATDDDGVSLPAGRYFFTIDGDNSQKEHIACTLSGTSLTSIKTVSRQGVETSGVLRKHRVGATVTITDFKHIKAINDLLDGTTNLDASTPLGYDGTASITTANQLATKAYVDGVAIAGAPDASTTVKGISKLSTAPASPTDPIAVGTNDTRMPTQGENDALAGSSGTPSSTNKYITEDDVSNAGASGKVVRLNGTTYPAGDGRNLTGIYPSVSSGENLTAGNPVYIDPASSLAYKAHGFKELDSTALNLTVSTTNKVSKLSDTQMMFLTHSGSTLTLTVYNINSAASVATATVTTNFDTTGISTTLTGATVCRLSDTTFIVFYAYTSDSKLYFRTGSISGGTITMDTETAYSGSPTYCFGLDSQPGDSNGKVVLTYHDSTNDVGSSATITPTLAYLTCSTNTATVTYSTTLTAFTSGAFFASPVWSVAQFTRGIAYGMFCVTNNGGVRIMQYAYIDSATGATDTNKEIPRLGLASGSGTSDSYSSARPYFAGHNGYAYFGYTVFNATGDIYTMSIIKLGTSGGVIEYQTTATEGSTSSLPSIIEIYGNEAGLIATNFWSTNYSSISVNTLYIQKDKIIPFYDLNELYTVNIQHRPQDAAWYSNSRDEIVTVYLSGSNGRIYQWKLPTPVNGFAVSTVTAPASTVVSKIGNTTGLTANSRYYLKDSYTNTGEIDTVGTIPVGQALSTTVIIQE